MLYAFARDTPIWLRLRRAGTFVVNPRPHQSLKNLILIVGIWQLS